MRKVLLCENLTYRLVKKSIKGIMVLWIIVQQKKEIKQN